RIGCSTLKSSVSRVAIGMRSSGTIEIKPRIGHCLRRISGVMGFVPRLSFALVALIGVFASHAVAQERPKDSAFLQALWPDAQAGGTTRKPLDAAFAGFTLDPGVTAATVRQPEYGRPVGAYVNSIATPERIATAAAQAAKWKHTLNAIEQQYGVDRFIIL